MLLQIRVSLPTPFQAMRAPLFHSAKLGPNADPEPLMGVWFSQALPSNVLKYSPSSPLMPRQTISILPGSVTSAGRVAVPTGLILAGAPMSGMRDDEV